MKRLWILLLVAALCATNVLFAQEKNPKAMIQARLEYMQKNLTLSGQENQNFWKVYQEYLHHIIYLKVYIKFLLIQIYNRIKLNI